jgi:hypothetical protein
MKRRFNYMYLILSMWLIGIGIYLLPLLNYMDILCLFGSLLCSENPKNNEALMAAAYIAGGSTTVNDRRKHQL